LINRKIFWGGGGIIDREMCVFFSTYFVWNISYSKKDSALWDSLDSFSVAISLVVSSFHATLDLF
jgi:hypothetical protein